MSEWLIVALAAVGIILTRIQSIHITFKGESEPTEEPEEAEPTKETKRLKTGQGRKQLKG